VYKRQALGFVVPLSISCGKKHEVVRKTLYRNFQELWTSHYGIRPSKLFSGVDQRITLIRAIRKGFPPCRVFSTRLHRWKKENVTKILEGAEYGYIGELSSGLIPKVAGEVGSSTYSKIVRKSTKVNDWFEEKDSQGVEFYYHSVARYWIKAYNFKPYFHREGEKPDISTKVKPIRIQNQILANRLLCLLNSSIFYYWWMTQSDEFDVLITEIASFGIPSNSAKWPSNEIIEELVVRLMSSYQSNSVRRQRRFGGRLVTYDEFYPRHSLNEIHAIDDVINPLYDLSEEENTFVKTYDMEFRGDEE